MCECINIEFGSYGNQVELQLPPHMVEYKRKQGGAATICVDRCLSDEIQQLWSLGITTTGCCCGHNKMTGQISVIEMDIPRMRSMGYQRWHNPMFPESDEFFLPKTGLYLNPKP